MAADGTIDFRRNHLDGVQHEPIAQPKDYPRNGWYPTASSLREFGDESYVVTEEFVERVGKHPEALQGVANRRPSPPNRSRPPRDGTAD